MTSSLLELLSQLKTVYSKDDRYDTISMAEHSLKMHKTVCKTFSLAAATLVLPTRIPVSHNQFLQSSSTPLGNLQQLQTPPVTKKMPGDKKLETAEELIEKLIEKLKGLPAVQGWERFL